MTRNRYTMKKQQSNKSTNKWLPLFLFYLQHCGNCVWSFSLILPNLIKRKSCSLNIFSLRCIFHCLFFKLLQFFFQKHSICMCASVSVSVCVNFVLLTMKSINFCFVHSQLQFSATLLMIEHFFYVPPFAHLSLYRLTFVPFNSTFEHTKQREQI